MQIFSYKVYYINSLALGRRKKPEKMTVIILFLLLFFLDSNFSANAIYSLMLFLGG